MRATSSCARFNNCWRPHPWSSLRQPAAIPRAMRSRYSQRFGSMNCWTTTRPNSRSAAAGPAPTLGRLRARRTPRASPTFARMPPNTPRRSRPTKLRIPPSHKAWGWGTHRIRRNEMQQGSSVTLTDEQILGLDPENGAGGTVAARDARPGESLADFLDDRTAASGEGRPLATAQRVSGGAKPQIEADASNARVAERPQH